MSELFLVLNGYQKNVRKKIISNRTSIVSPSFSGKTYVIKKFLKNFLKREFSIITRSPNQFINDIVAEKKLDEKVNMNLVLYFLMICWIITRKQYLYSSREKHKDINVYYLWQSNFDLPKRTVKTNSDLTFLLKQTFLGVENLNRDNAGVDLSYDEFKDLCRGAWNYEEYNYLCCDESKMESESKYFIYNGNRPERYTVRKPETERFYKNQNLEITEKFK